MYVRRLSKSQTEGAAFRGLSYIVLFVLLMSANLSWAQSATEIDRTSILQEVTLTSVSSQSPATSHAYPQAQAVLRLLNNEMMQGMTDRGINSRYGLFQGYAHNRLDVSTTDRTGSELTGLCRLPWYDALYRNMAASPFEMERFSSDLHEGLSGSGTHKLAAWALIRSKMSVPARTVPTAPASADSPEAALQQVQRVLLEAQSGYARALAPLTEAEVGQLDTNLYNIFTAECVNGHTIPKRPTGALLCQHLRKMDRAALYDAGDAFLSLADDAFLDQLAALTDQQNASLTNTAYNGTVSQRISTSAGDILIGGRGSNSYSLDALGDVAAVIDLGGNDVYADGSTAPQRRVMIIIDLGGDDRYQSTRPGVQGSAVMGASLLIDRSGNDIYEGRDVAQGSALGGIGILIDQAGDDRYAGIKRVQGQALGGVGLLIDNAGRDSYRAALWGQGFGNPLGFGCIEDSDGADTYFLGGMFYDSYDETPGYDGWGQGVGAGIRQSANGGVGVMLDGGGDDTYEFDYMSHGGGYWLGVGIARDFGGNDQRLGATRTHYNGGRRTESRFQRFSNGFGCHYALGFLIDDAGDDVYHGTIMGVGMGWDMAYGMLADFGGNDQYTAAGNYVQGIGAQGSYGVLFDYDGTDEYKGRGQGYASSGVSYHSTRNCGGNFSFVVDYGGDDTYGSGAKDNTYNKRGANGGFLIDRAKEGEAAPAGSPSTPPSNAASGVSTLQNTGQLLSAPPATHVNADMMEGVREQEQEFRLFGGRHR
jgi:hypothetical protein